MAEKFSPGDKVFLIHLMEAGYVTRLQGADMVYVQLKDMEIPVYLTDITSKMPDQRPPSENSKPVKKKDDVVAVKTENEHEKNDSGLFLCFEPIYDHTGDIRTFKICLVNDTSFTIEFRYRFFLSGNIHFQLDRKILPYEFYLLHEIVHDALNEMPEVDVSVRDEKNELLTGELTQKIRPQNFFNKLGQSPLTGTESFVYPVPTSSLKKPIRPSPKKNEITFDADVLKAMMLDSAPNKDMELAQASREVDLHIDKLVGNHYKMDNSEILHVQLARFQQSLDQAIAGGIDRFYVIHGNGKGKLKREIHHLLKTYKEVKSFNNDYHPKYAHGATEIILR